MQSLLDMKPPQNLINLSNSVAWKIGCVTAFRNTRRQYIQFRNYWKLPLKSRKRTKQSLYIMYKDGEYNKTRIESFENFKPELSPSTRLAYAQDDHELFLFTDSSEHFYNSGQKRHNCHNKIREKSFSMLRSHSWAKHLSTALQTGPFRRMKVLQSLKLWRNGIRLPWATIIHPYRQC